MAAELLPLMAMTGNVGNRPVTPNDAENPPAAAQFDYATLASLVRALYDALEDAARSHLIVDKRKTAQPGQFNTPRLHALQGFVLRVGGAARSVDEQEYIYFFLEVLYADTDAVDGDKLLHGSLRAKFPTPHAFVHAMRDEFNAAVLEAGWRKVKIEDDGMQYEAYYL